MDGRAGAPGVSLPATIAPVALNLGSGSSPLMSLLIAAGRALEFVVRTRLDLRVRLGLVSEIADLCLGALDLSRVHLVEAFEKSAKNVV